MQIFLRPRPVCLLLVVIYLASQANLITLLQNSSDKTGSDINPENLQGILIPSGKFFTPPDSSKKSKKRPIAHATALRHTAIAGKEDKNLTTPSYMHVERTDKSIVFVHIGKAGGETIKAALEVGCAVKKNKLARKQCKTSLQHSALSDQVKGYFHCFRVLPKENVINQTTTTSYLYNIRHPVHRIVSWYRYIHPSHCNAENKGISQNCQAAVSYRSSNEM